MDEVFRQNSLSESSSLYMLREGEAEHGRRLDSIVNQYRKTYKMFKMDYRETQATKELGMFLPVYQKSL